MTKQSKQSQPAPAAKSISEILTERQSTHGSFTEHSKIAQDLKRTVHAAAGWPVLTDAMKESLDMNCHKMARILAGKAAYKDHWDDIAGYATLVARELP
jgi:hypothetical protein